MAEKISSKGRAPAFSLLGADFERHKDSKRAIDSYAVALLAEPSSRILLGNLARLGAWERIDDVP